MPETVTAASRRYRPQRVAAGIFLAGCLGPTVPVTGLDAAARFGSLTTGLTAF